MHFPLSTNKLKAASPGPKHVQDGTEVSAKTISNSLYGMKASKIGATSLAFSSENVPRVEIEILLMVFNCFCEHLFI